MNTPILDRLRSEAQALSSNERAHLALDLLQSLDSGTTSSDTEQAWNNEAARRLACFDRDGSPTIAADQVHAHALARLR